MLKRKEITLMRVSFFVLMKPERIKSRLKSKTLVRIVLKNIIIRI